MTHEDAYLNYQPNISTMPQKFQQLYDSWTPEQREGWRNRRFKALHDHIFLGTVVLGMDFQENPHRILFDQFLHKQPGVMVPLDAQVDSATGILLPAELIQIALSDLDHTTKKRMILWPRGLFKTSAVIVEIVQMILNYPNVRICFLTGGDQLAKRQLARVKRVFERPTENFLSLFPEHCGIKDVFNEKEEKWIQKPMKLGTAHEFTVPCRTNDTFAEPTFAISTAKSVKAGSHYDVIFIDDLVNETNYRSVKLLEKCYQDYIDICPVLEPTGFIIMTGTRYSFGDAYQRIQDMAKEEEKQLGKTIWKFSIRNCWASGCQNCVHSSAWHDEMINIIEPPCTAPSCTCRGYEDRGTKDVLFPAVRTKDGRSIGHTIEFLEGERVRLGPEFFANQYENNPIAEGSQTFTEELLDKQTLFHENQIPSFSSSFTFGVADLAYVGQEGRDYSVLLMCRLYQGQIFVFDCLFGNWDSGAVASNIVGALLMHRPNVIFIEKFNGWEAYNSIIAAHATARGIQRVPVQWEKGSQAENAKLIRIGAAKGVFAARRLWLYSAMKGFDTLIDQLKKWPKLGRHDDFADCLGMVVAAPVGYQLETPPEKPSMGNWLRRLHASHTLDDSYGDNGCGSGIVCGLVTFGLSLPFIGEAMRCLFTH